MITTVSPNISLENFLKLPDTKPASELINGKISEKAMPQGEHSRLQCKLCSTINEIAEPAKIACAFPELRCIFGGHVIVPDIAVFRWERLPLTASGRIANRFEIHPDWCIEILSPEQSITKVLEKLLLCSEHGTELCWLIIPEDETILTILPQQKIQLLKADEQLPILSKIELPLTVNQIFSWLKIE